MVYEQITPEELCKLWQSGDEKAFDELYTQFFPKLRTFIKNHFPVFPEDDITDIIQDVFIKFFNNNNFDFTKGVKFYTWLCKICWNTCIDRCRKRGYRSPELSLEQENILIFLDTEQTINLIQEAIFFNLYKLSAEEILLKKEVIESVQSAISQANLSLEEKTAIDLFLLLHREPRAKEIDEALEGLSNKSYCENTLRNKWKKAIAKLSRILQTHPLFADLASQSKKDKENDLNSVNNSEQVLASENLTNETI